MTPLTYSRVKAFTLVELLVVISIIAVLAAILLSVVSGMRQRADMSKCISHLRQLGMGISLYLVDTGRYPDVSGSSGPRMWDRQIMPYIGVQNIPTNTNAPVVEPNLKKQLEIFACPSDKTVRNVPGSYPRSYGILGWVIGEAGYGGGQPGDGVRSIILPSPTKTVVLTELHSFNHYVGSANYETIGTPSVNTPKGFQWAFHAKRANALFADGHVESLHEMIPATFYKTFWPSDHVHARNNAGAPPYQH